jgi:hypothetical protein
MPKEIQLYSNYFQRNLLEVLAMADNIEELYLCKP